MLEFLVAALVVVASPGPGATYTIATTASQGWRLGWFAALGCTLGVAPHLIVASTGLATVLRPGTAAFEVLRWAGVTYLAFLAIQALRCCRQRPEGAAKPVATAQPARTASGVLRRAITMNLLNPKLTVFFLAFLPQFAGHSPASPGTSPTLLGVIFMGITLVVFLGYSQLTHAARSVVAARPGGGRWFGGVVGTTYAVLAVRLAMP
jgi:threonine/homoserine/homoserine lactone efflux protein